MCFKISYCIELRVKERWFKDPVVVYDIYRKSKVWHDTTYGRGGGDWIEVSKKVATLLDSVSAEDMLDKLTMGVKHG